MVRACAVLGGLCAGQTCSYLRRHSPGSRSHVLTGGSKETRGTRPWAPSDRPTVDSSFPWGGPRAPGAGSGGPPASVIAAVPRLQGTALTQALRGGGRAIAGDPPLALSAFARSPGRERALRRRDHRERLKLRKKPLLITKENGGEIHG